MRLTPAQCAVRLICGTNLPGFGRLPVAFSERVRKGREMFVRMTGRDFGYDLQAWHNYLKESRDGGYTYGRKIELPKPMKLAIESAEWQEAVQQLASEEGRTES